MFEDIIEFLEQKKYKEMKENDLEKFIKQERINVKNINGFKNKDSIILIINISHKNIYNEKVEEILKNRLISRRIAYNLAVYLKAKEFFIEETYDDYINEAFKFVADTADVTVQSIQDKTYRQIGLKSSQYKRLLLNALNGQKEELKDILFKNVSKNLKEFDEEVINDILDNF